MRRPDLGIRITKFPMELVFIMSQSRAKLLEESVGLGIGGQMLLNGTPQLLVPNTGPFKKPLALGRLLELERHIEDFVTAVRGVPERPGGGSGGWSRDWVRIHTMAAPFELRIKCVSAIKSKKAGGNLVTAGIGLLEAQGIGRGRAYIDRRRQNNRPKPPRAASVIVPGSGTATI